MRNRSGDDKSAARLLGEYLRAGRKRKHCTIADMAAKLGRPREWLNRIELGYSDQGEYKPPSLSDLQAIADFLGSSLQVTLDDLKPLRDEAEAVFKQSSRRTGKVRLSIGKLTQTEVLMGEKQIVYAITSLIAEQYSDAVIRNTGVKGPGGYAMVDDNWKLYRLALGKFLEENPNALFKRIEYANNPAHLTEAREADKKLAGRREITNVHNAKIKFYKENPLQLHVLIGQREAILALPQTSGKAGSNMAILIRDKIFVEALRVWYDEILWDAPGEHQNLDYQNFDDSFESIRRMYGF